MHKAYPALLVIIGIVALLSALTAYPDGSPEDPNPKNLGSSAPGEWHELLHDFAGEWKGDGEIRDAQGAKQAGVFSASMKMVIGGRFLEYEVKCKAQDAVYERIGFIGYDTGNKFVVGVAMDSLGTHVATLYGGIADVVRERVLTFEGVYIGDIGKSVSTREVVRLSKKGELSWDSWSSGVATPFLSMRLRRQK